MNWASFPAEDTISRPLDLCTTKKSVVLTNNNSYDGTQLLQASTASSSSKAIWSPASSCEEENRNQLSCTACQRSFGSPTKLELHLRKVHPTSHHSVVGGSSRKERIFKVYIMCPVYFFTHLLSLVPAADAAEPLQILPSRFTARRRLEFYVAVAREETLVTEAICMKSMTGMSLRFFDCYRLLLKVSEICT